MAIEDDQRLTSSEDQYAIGVSAQVSTVLSLFGRRISAYIGIMMVPVIYSFLFSTIMFLVFGPAMLLYIGWLGSEPISFIWGASLLLTEPIPPDVIGPFLAVGGVLMFIGFILNLIVLGAAVSIALRSYTGQTSSMGDGFSSSMDRFSTLLPVTLIIGSIYALIMIPIQESLVAILDAMLINDFDTMTQATGVLMALAIVFIFVITLLYPNVAVVIGEDKGTGGSIGRTVSLTKSSFLHTIAGVLLFYTILVVITLVIDIGLVMLLGGTLTTLITPFTTMLIITPMTYIYQAVLYKDLAARTAQTDQEYW